MTGAHRQVLFIADDFGASVAVNDAIVDAHINGALDGACLMMGQPGTDDAVERARDHPSLIIGWHLHLCDSVPTTTATWPWGASPMRAGLAIAFTPRGRKLARAEISHQWQLLRATGLPVATVNAHHHLHWHPFVSRILAATVAGEFDGWLRWGQPRFFGRDRPPIGYALANALLLRPNRSRLRVATSTSLWGLDRTFNMNANEIEHAITSLGDGIHEFMFHPRPAPKDADTACLIELARRRALNPQAVR